MNIGVFEEEWFSGISLTGDDTYTPDLIKYAKEILKKKFPFDTNQHVCKISVNIGWNT